MIEVQLHPGMLYMCFIMCILLSVIIWRINVLIRHVAQLINVCIGIRNRF